MSDGAELTLTAHHSAYLPAEGGVVDVVASVRGGAPGGGETSHDGLAEVILLDCSGSMGAPQAKMRAARAATLAALDALPDGVAFAVVEGTDRATMCYPAEPGLAVAGERTRAEARQVVRRMQPHGGTAIGRWLLLARDLLAGRPDAIGHVILLTDGRNESQHPDELRAAVAACTDRFTVDCRAVGSADGVHDWDGTELLGIAETLGGNPVVPVEDLAALAADFAVVLTQAMTRRVGDARLRVRTPEIARIRFVKQVFPTIVDLTPRGVAVGALGTDFPIGAWSPTDQRDYQVALEVDPMPAGATRRIGWLSLHTGSGAQGDEEPLTVEFTDEVDLFSTVHDTVAHYTGQQDYADAFRRGLRAAEAGRLDEAEEHFGRAVALAHAGGNRDKLALLARIVEVLDAPAGRVRLRRGVDPRKRQPSVVHASQTSRWRAAEPAAVPAPAVAAGPWRHCGQERTSAFCGDCGVGRHASGVDA
ncbi:VWA domain-containing protein [Micromonospora mangrovi]|uniref:VWA domain-containing protein n=1 Tax=Micromonospora sp. CCTCC AA 2012012 TaxID=3111921 RepID=A0AAU7MGL4_9ACTN